MSPVTHQTIKLSKGKHSAPEDGACVMELASMLAGESFTDHPESVCPAIGSFLRAYNDSIDEGRRQDLYAYASLVVGTRGGAEVEQARAERLAAWAAEVHPRRWHQLLPAPLRARVSRRHSPTDAVGTHAVHAIRKHGEQSHVAVLALLDELLAIGAEEQQPQPEERPRPQQRPLDELTSA
jgi:hypothetical protein